MSTYRLGPPSDFKRRMEASLNIRVVPRDQRERRHAAYDADHYEMCAYYTTVSHESLDVLEKALKAVPGVYATTQVRRASDRVTAKNIFTNPGWPAKLGTERRDRNELRTQVLVFIRDEEPSAARAEEIPKPSIFRYAECGDGARLRGWVHVNAHGPVGADGVIEHYEGYAKPAGLRPCLPRYPPRRLAWLRQRAGHRRPVAATTRWGQASRPAPIRVLNNPL